MEISKDIKYMNTEGGILSVDMNSWNKDSQDESWHRWEVETVMSCDDAKRQELKEQITKEIKRLEVFKKRIDKYSTPFEYTLLLKRIHHDTEKDIEIEFSAIEYQALEEGKRDGFRKYRETVEKLIKEGKTEELKAYVKKESN